MLRLIGRRLLLMIPTLILASMLIFALAEVLPGDVGRSILGPYATEETGPAAERRSSAPTGRWSCATPRGPAAS